MAVNGGHAGTKKGPNWGHVSFGYFLFFLLGEGEGGVEAPEGGGGSVFIEKPRRGKGSPGREGPVSAANWGIWGGDIFFSGPKCPPRYYIAMMLPNI